MAKASEPSTGSTPMASPVFLLPVLISVHFPNALIGPPFAALPNAISSISPVEAIRITNKT